VTQDEYGYINGIAIDIAQGFILFFNLLFMIATVVLLVYNVCLNRRIRFLRQELVSLKQSQIKEDKSKVET